jgi:hypothetical protein
MSKTTAPRAVVTEHTCRPVGGADLDTLAITATGDTKALDAQPPRSGTRDNGSVAVHEVNAAQARGLTTELSTRVRAAGALALDWRRALDNGMQPRLLGMAEQAAATGQRDELETTRSA